MGLMRGNIRQWKWCKFHGSLQRGLISRYGKGK